jgi:hypothetical protein
MGGAMEVYEIKILNAHGQALFNFKDQFRSDTSAVREAKLLSRGRTVEVWNDRGRIFRAVGDNGVPKIGDGPPDQAA